jgi:hypothetical protein
MRAIGRSEPVESIAKMTVDEVVKVHATPSAWCTMCLLRIFALYYTIIVRCRASSWRHRAALYGSVIKDLLTDMAVTMACSEYAVRRLADARTWEILVRDSGSCRSWETIAIVVAPVTGQVPHALVPLVIKCSMCGTLRPATAKQERVNEHAALSAPAYAVIEIPCCGRPLLQIFHDGAVFLDRHSPHMRRVRCFAGLLCAHPKPGYRAQVAKGIKRSTMA